MRDVLNDIMKWWDAGETVGLATVVRTFRSAPREPGAALAVGADGEVVGSVSGGCVEGAVYELCGEVTSTGQPVLQTYGVSDDDAFAVGLTCGGILDVFVEPVSRELFPELVDLAAAVEREESVAVATVISGPGRIGARRIIYADAAPAGSLGAGDRLDAAVDDDARGMLAQGQTAIRRYGTQGERRHDELAVFVNSFAPPPRMMVFGAIDFAAAVAHVGKFMGYRVTVCDARAVFATTARFRDADEVIVEWPHRYLAGADVDERTVICVLTHDPKFDVPLLEVALRTPAGDIGAMGSRRTHEDRLARLREAGLTEAELSRLRSPIGLDLGARTPEETAVSIAAELIQLRWGGSGRPLTSTDGRIHPVTAARELSGASVLTAGYRQRRADSDHHQPPGSADEFQPPRRPPEPGPRRPGYECPAAVGQQRDRGEDGSEQQHLLRNLTGLAVDELRQYGGEEDDRLRVSDADHEPVGHDPGDALVLDPRSEHLSELLPVPDRLNSQEDEVRRAAQLDDREDHDRSLDERADPERDGHHLDIHAEGVTGHGGYPRHPPERERPAHGEQHARPRHHDQGKGGERKGEEVRCGKHAASLTRSPLRGHRIFGRRLSSRLSRSSIPLTSCSRASPESCWPRAKAAVWASPRPWSRSPASDSSTAVAECSVTGERSPSWSSPVPHPST